ncbi:protein angel isoform X2 [Cephus cinctus]|uniref:Protein angel isoform X2 n=1 Tax=Cephus cinctus TaxID=211228 RepID=A0AAJ7R9Y9_CEPCN|nr:protein angel isoform X2 [Cephus cinctus]
MSASTRLLTTVSVASVVCRNVHVAIFSQEILHMSEVPLKHLFIRNIRKSTFVPEALFSTYLNLLESISSPATHQEFNKTIMEPYLESCYVLNDTSPIHEVPVNIGDDIVLSDGEDTSRSDSMDVDIMKECGGSLDIKCPMSKQDYKALRKWKRFGKEKLAINSNDTFVLRLLSFNILAQNLLETHSYLYKAHDKRALSWESRKSLLFQEILQADANVICLQEVQNDHLGEIVKPFRDLGYAYLYKKRTNDKEDGLLLLYRSDQFNLVDHAKVELYQSGIELLSRDNVGLIAKLSLKDSPDTQIVIATTHLLYNPRRNDVRLGQIQMLFAELERIAFIENTPTGARYHPIILAGDFNLEPYTGVYKFITEGTFEYVGKARNLEPAEYRLFCRLSNMLIPPRLYVTDSCQHYNILKKRLRGEGDGRVMLENSETKELHDESNSTNDPASIYKKSEVDVKTSKCQKIELIDGNYASFSSGRLVHPFKFKNVYQHADRYGNPEATTNQGKWITVDYIFYTEIQPFEKYTLPTVEQCNLFPTIPNFTVGSDHLCLGASFKLQKKKH